MVIVLSSVLDGNLKSWHLKTDRSSEFKNKAFSRLLKEMGVKHFFSSNEKKSCFTERAITTIKSKLSRYVSPHQTQRWIDVLKSVTDSYNGTYHRSIKMSPKFVTKKEEIRLWKMQYLTNSGKPPLAFKINIGESRQDFSLTKTFRSGTRRTIDDWIFRHRFKICQIRNGDLYPWCMMYSTLYILRLSLLIMCKGILGWQIPFDRHRIKQIRDITHS